MPGSRLGELLACHPPSLLEFRWGPDVLRLELQADGEGTVLTLLDTLEEGGKAARDGAGWHVCLDRLQAHRDGRESATAWQEVHPGYVERFGAEASGIGPPERGR